MEGLEFFLKSFISGFTTNQLLEFQQVGVVRGLEASSGSADSAPLLEPSVSSLTRAKRATWWCVYLRPGPGTWSTSLKSPGDSRGDSATDCSRSLRKPDPVGPAGALPRGRDGIPAPA